MQDLSATLFYKAKFTATLNNSQDDLLWLLVYEIRAWLIGKWNIKSHRIITTDTKDWTSFKFGGKLFDQEKTNHIYGESSLYVDEETNAISWACKIVEKKEPKDGYAQREWTTEIGYQSIDDYSAIISYVVTYNDMPGFIGFCEEPPTSSVPRIIRSLLSHEKITCSIGPTKLSNDPIWLNPGDYPGFEKIVFDPSREVPVIYISPQNTPPENDDTPQRLLLLSPFSLAKSVAANAIVYCSNSTEFADEMRWFIDNRYGCYNGAIRIYRPKINQEDANDHYKHRFISATFIQEYGENAILDIFRRALAQDVHYYDTMFRLDTCKSLIAESVRKKRIRALQAKSKSEVDEAYQEYLIESDERREAEQRARIYKDELDREKSDNFNLQIQLDALKKTADQAKQIESASFKIREISKYPDTPYAIAKYCETLFADRIVFTERAYRSLQDCITRNDYLWEVFFCIANELYDLLHKSPAQAYKTFTAKTGWECSRGAGTMTRNDKNLMRQYVDYYEGQEINIEAHIKSGNKDNDSKSVRVYFAYDPQITDKIIIGHCGKHIDNYSTRKVK